ncbi:MAG TPA: hypothetical protein VGK84_03705 [Candidatus Tumulicola sp.]
MDVLSVVLISVAAVLTALCGYQSGLWDGDQTRMYSTANADRLHSAEDADRANVLTGIDVAVFIHYVQAVDAGNARFERFLYRRFRPEFVPAVRAWLATKPFQNAGAPSSPFVMPQYRLKSRIEAGEFEKQAALDFDAAGKANRNADAFLLLTVIFAAVSFLAGISTKMVFPNHAIVVALALLGLIYGVYRLLELPFTRMG